jgi:hypothetical protein
MYIKKQTQPLQLYYLQKIMCSIWHAGYPQFLYITTLIEGEKAKSPTVLKDVAVDAYVFIHTPSLLVYKAYHDFQLFLIYKACTFELSHIHYLFSR